MSRLTRFSIALLVGIPLYAAADPKTEAQKHVDRAFKLHAGGKFVEALDELKTAYALDPRPELLYAMGQIHVSLGDCAQAVTYYERFLATKPDPDIGNAAKEAIDVCKNAPPPKLDEPPKPVEPAKPVEPPKVVTRVEEAPWYADKLGDGLVAGGVVASVSAIFVYRAALGDRDRADSATSYDGYASLVDSAHAKRSTAIAIGVVGIAAAAAGAAHLVLADRDRSVAVTPAAGGGVVSFAGKF